MAFDSQIVTIFVSSPGDVSQDRRIVLDEMQAWNQRNAKNRGCFLNPLTWEDLVSPDIGESSQDVINVEVGDDYDVFLGLMWGRFGTPTTKAESGTQEEFERALKRKNEGGALRISFFFRKSDIPLDDIDIDQLGKVRKFQKELGEFGAFYGQYSDERELVSALTMLFDRIASEKTRYLAPRMAMAVSGAVSDIAEEDDHAEVISDPDAGLFDLEDELTRNTEKFASDLSDWGGEFSKLNSTVRTTTANMNSLSQFGKPDRAEVRTEIDRITTGLAEFADFAQAKIPLIEDSLDGMYTAMNGIAVLSHEFNIEKQQKEQLITRLSELLDRVGESGDSLTQYISIMEGLPRIEKKFNVARNLVVSVHKQLRKKLRDFKGRLEEARAELER